MKEFLNKKVLPVWAIILVLVFLLLLFAMGFRVTYGPWIANNWDAIAAVGTWLAVIVSGIAIWFAVSIPIRIAENQNRISLFEKRCEFRDVLSTYVMMNRFLPSITEYEVFETFFVASFYQALSKNVVHDMRDKKLAKMDAFSYSVGVLKQYEYLFDSLDEPVIFDLISTIMSLVVQDNPPEKENFLKQKEHLSDVIIQVQEVVVPQIESSLKLARI